MDFCENRKRVARAVLVAAMCAAAGPTAGASAKGRGLDPAVRRGADAFATLERQRIQALSAVLDGLARDPALLAAFRARDRAGLLSLATPRFAKLQAEQQITLWYFHEREPEQRCFLRVHAPELHGDTIPRETLSQAIATRRTAAGKELGRTAFALRVVTPIAADGQILGYMELGEEIGHYLSRMKEQTGDDFGLLVDKRFVDRKELARVRGEDLWEHRKELVLVDSTVWNDRSIDVPVPLASLTDEGANVGEWNEGALRYVGGAVPVRDGANRVVGALFVRHQVAPCAR